jgi:4-azaleucine resistance transporter AzlC
VLGIIPFGLISGVAAVEIGLNAVEALGMSVLVFAGSAQLAAVQLLGAGASAAVILLTTLVINLRFVMYSAALAPHLKRLERPWRFSLAYLLTDQAFALSVTRFTEDTGVRRRWFYLGVSLPLWLVWQAATLAGVLVGAQLPASLSLGFAIPLTFLALTFPAVQDRPTAAAAVSAAAVAVAAANLPYNLGLILAAVTGVAVGLVLEARR